MVHLHAAIAIDQNQRSGLIEKRRGEGNAELHGRDREAAFCVWMKRVPPINLFPPLRESAGFFETPPDDFDTVGVLHRLSIMGGVAVTIEIAFADNLRGQAKPARRLVHNFFDDQHALRTAEPAKRSLRSLMSEAD